MSGWSFEPILDSYWIVAGLCASLLILLLSVAPWRDPDAPRRRTVLLLLRFASIALLALAMLRPVYRSTQSRPQSSTLLVLFDRSRSMSVEDSAGGQSRWAQLVKSLRATGQQWQELAKAFEVQAFGFAESLDAKPAELTFEKLPKVPQGQQTDLAGALSEAVRRQAGKRLAGVIVLSDGVQRVLQPRVDIQQIARELHRSGVPLYTVPFGKARDQSQARDVAIEKLPDHFVVFAKNELEIRGALRVQGYVNQSIPVIATLEGPEPGKRQQLGPTEMMAKQDDQLMDFSFVISPELPGNYTLRVEAPRQNGELVVTNNQLTAYLQVLEGGIKLLYVDLNLVGPEQQILRRSLASSPDIEMDYRPVDLRLRDQWPIALETDTPLSSYDIVMLGDVPADALGEENLSKLVKFVESGKGLMMLGGLNTFGPGGYGRERMKAFARMLPIQMSALDFQELGVEQTVPDDVHVPGPIKMVPRPHFITQLAPSAAANQAAWEKLPPLLGANRFKGLQPRALRLAESDGPSSEPLLVAWEYDRGRVLVFAGDSTHRWWRQGFADLHKRFWRQCMLWLANQDEQLRRDVWIQLARHRFEPGESLQFTAGARDELGNVLTDVQLTAQLQRQQEPPQELRMAVQGEEWQGPSVELTAPGSYQLRVKATADGKEIGSAVAQFQVVARDLELSEPAASPEQMAMLARITQSVGGRSLPPEQLTNLLQEILQNPPKMEVELESKWRFGDGTLDIWPFFLIFVTVLGAEWTLRKKWGMT